MLLGRLMRGRAVLRLNVTSLRLVLHPRRQLRERMRRLKQNACDQCRPADDVPHSPNHQPPLQVDSQCALRLNLLGAYRRSIARESW